MPDRERRHQAREDRPTRRSLRSELRNELRAQLREEVVDEVRGQLRHARRPRGGTRERILDVALDLFTERGYDKTSLREIADELGFTKAALYYHFERKEEILLGLHLRLHALGHDVLDKLRDVHDVEHSVDIWASLLDDFIDQVLANRKLFLFHSRNRQALEHIAHDEHNRAEHDDMEEELQRFLGDPRIPTAVRVRMACSLGAVMGVLMGSEGAFTDVSSEELARLVREAVHGLLQGGAGAGKGAPRKRAATSSPSRRSRRSTAAAPGATGMSGGARRPRPGADDVSLG